MRNFIFAVIFLSLTAAASSAQVSVQSIEGVVTKISDGDSIRVTDSSGTRIKVRLFGIDSPEAAKRSNRIGIISKPGQPFGEEAFRALQAKLQLQKVRLDVMEIDRNGRTVAIVRLGDRNINLEMVAEGWAWVYRKHLDNIYGQEYIRAEELARGKRLGLWQQSKPQPPWEFRNIMRLKSWFSSPFLW